MSELAGSVIGGVLGGLAIGITLTAVVTCCVCKAMGKVRLQFNMGNTRSYSTDTNSNEPAAAATNPVTYTRKNSESLPANHKTMPPVTLPPQMSNSSSNTMPTNFYIQHSDNQDEKPPRPPPPIPSRHQSFTLPSATRLVATEATKIPQVSTTTAKQHSSVAAPKTLTRPPIAMATLGDPPVATETKEVPEYDIPHVFLTKRGVYSESSMHVPQKMRRSRSLDQFQNFGVLSEDPFDPEEKYKALVETNKVTEHYYTVMSPSITDQHTVGKPPPPPLTPKPLGRQKPKHIAVPFDYTSPSPTCNVPGSPTTVDSKSPSLPASPSTSPPVAPQPFLPKRLPYVNIGPTIARVRQKQKL